MKKILFAAFLALVLAVCAGASAEDAQITVTGTGEVWVNADTATISLGVTAQAAAVTDAQQEVNTRIAAVRQALLDAGVAPEDITTGSISLYAETDYSGAQAQVVGYTASSTLSVRTEKTETAGSLIDAAFAAGANLLNDVSFSASDTDAAQDEALRKAAAAARQQADTLADAAGMKVSGLVSLTGGGTWTYTGDANSIAAKSASAEDAGTYVQAAKVCVQATVTATYTAN